MVAQNNRIKMYRSKTCERCSTSAFLMKRVISSHCNLSYEDCIMEKDVETDSEAMAEMMMLDSMEKPVLDFGSFTVSGKDAANAKVLRESFVKWMAENSIPKAETA